MFIVAGPENLNNSKIKGLFPLGATLRLLQLKGRKTMEKRQNKVRERRQNKTVKTTICLII